MTLPGKNAAAVAVGPEIRIAHPKGVVAATVDLDPDPNPPVRAVGIVRTARRLLDGVAYPREVRHDCTAPPTPRERR